MLAGNSLNLCPDSSSQKTPPLVIPFQSIHFILIFSTLLLAWYIFFFNNLHLNFTVIICIICRHLGVQILLAISKYLSCEYPWGAGYTPHVFNAAPTYSELSFWKRSWLKRRRILCLQKYTGKTFYSIGNNRIHTRKCNMYVSITKLRQYPSG